jgi:coenzyme F420-reducing hydrogenase beta subunit
MLFEFAVSRSAETLRQGAHSHYYPVTLARVLSHIKADPGVRYALVGIPCFIKAARLLSRQDAALCDAIRFYIGLVCGHLKSTGFAQLLGWQSGIDPGSLVGVDFRDKLAGRSPRHYGFRAIGRTRAADIDIARPMSEVFGADWGLGFFKYKACDFCDDVFAETADVVVGDAWLPQFDHDWQGTNILIVRHPIFADILAAAAAESRISIAPLSADQAAASQRSGLRHRREGLSARIHAARDRGEWHPPKRVAAGADNIPRMRRRLYELRELMRTASHEAFAEARRRNDLAFFTERMAPMVKQYYDHFKPGMGHRVVNRLKRLWAAWQRETEPR